MKGMEAWRLPLPRKHGEQKRFPRDLRGNTWKSRRKIIRRWFLLSGGDIAQSSVSSYSQRAACSTGQGRTQCLGQKPRRG